MRLRIRAKLILAFLFVAGVSVITATVIPLHLATGGIEKKNRELIDNQREAFNKALSVFYEKAGQLAGRLRNQAPLLDLMREERWTEASRRGQEMVAEWTGLARKTPAVEGQQDALDFEVFMLPPQKAGLLAEGLQREATMAVCFVRSADLGVTDGRRKAYHGQLSFMRGKPKEGETEGRVLGAVFVGYPLIEDTSPVEPKAGMFQKPAEILSTVPGLGLEFIVPESAQFQHWLESNPSARRKIFEEKELFRNDDYRWLGEVYQVLLQPIVAPTGEIISIAFFRIERPRFLAPWNSIQKNFIIAALLSSILAILLAVPISKSLSRPIRMLSRRAHAVAGGRLDQPAEVRSNDEIGDLAAAFNTMQAELGRQLGELKRRAETIEHQNVQLDHTIHELSRMKDYTENVLQSVRVGVVTFDRERRITKINDTAVQILEAEGRDVEEVEDHLSDGPLRNILEMGLSEGKTITDQEIDLLTFGGQHRPAEVTSGLLRREGDVIGLVISYRDLTMVKSLQEQVRRQDRLASLGHLSAGVAHEIRNPLAIIKGSAEILRRRFRDKDGEEGLSDSIIEEVNRLSKVVTNFLDFARPKEPSIVEEDLNGVVRKALALAEHHRSGGGIRVNTHFDPDLPPVPVDPEQCEQVFLNLILNALESMKDGGVLVVRSRVEGDNAMVEVQDTGEGISEETLENIFDPFFTSKDQGTGLGLSVVHMIVTAHRGRIEVESEPFRGSIFRVFFPLKASEVGRRRERDTGPPAEEEEPIETTPPA